MTKVSIITVAYNAEATIEDTLKSVAAQSWPDVEHIVVDGASKDATIAIVQKHLREGGIFISEPDDGLYDAMNKGIEGASGDIIGLLNADDVFADTNVIERVVRAFRDGRTDAILGDVGYFRDGYENRIIRRYNSGRFKPSRVAWGWMPAHPAMYLTREAYKKVGPYKTDYKIAADYEFVVRAFTRNRISFCYLSDILVKMRMGGKSTAGLSASITINIESVRACRENGIKTNLAMIMSKYPIKLLELIQLDRNFD
jgi:glycosyltransferase involved in cell wall biosynthesis